MFTFSCDELRFWSIFFTFYSLNGKRKAWVLLSPPSGSESNYTNTVYVCLWHFILGYTFILTVSQSLSFLDFNPSSEHEFLFLHGVRRVLNSIKKS